MVENIHHDIQSLVHAGHFLDVQVHICDSEQATETADIFAHVRGQGGLSGKASHELTQSDRPFLHQVGDINPERVIAHLERLIELEALSIEMKPQPGERLDVAVEKLRRPTAHDAVQRGYPLLTVEQEFDDACRERPVAAVSGRFGLGCPHEQATHRTAQVERREQFSNLVAVPDIPALEFWQCHVPTVDVVEDGRGLHTFSVPSLGSSCIVLAWPR